MRSHVYLSHVIYIILFMSCNRCHVIANQCNVVSHVIDIILMYQACDRHDLLQVVGKIIMSMCIMSYASLLLYIMCYMSM